ncbi:type VII secretion protein EsaA [Virgibacillus kimchii]
MKNLDKRWLLFLVLILVLATGLPYLSLNQEASTTPDMETEDARSMSIALVNEDEGAVFNGSELTFGEAFVRSLDTNDDHEWYVVSRGVAESGLNRNTYDMMIVIPNDFSEKALSIDSESPEQVVLNYQINASDDENVRAEAERTASTILNEFNRRIIDVYFASIIGNLQDAQDNIGEIVEQQSQYTTTYNNDINNPLSNYTNQFGTIKDNTQVSRDSFGSLEDLLEGFEDRLSDGAEQKQGYLSNLDEFTSTKEGNVNELLSFSDALLQFDNSLNSTDVQEQLVQLQDANRYIGLQLDQDGSDRPNLVTESNNLKEYIQEEIQNARRVQNYLINFDDRVAGNVEGYLFEVFSNGLREDVEYLNQYIGDMVEDFDLLLERFENLHENHASLYEDHVNLRDQHMNLHDQYDILHESIHEEIRGNIEQLPTISKKAIKKLAIYGLEDEIISDAIEVIDNTKKYLEKYEDEDLTSPPNKRNILREDIRNIKEHFANETVTMTDRVKLEEINKDEVYFSIESLPRHFEFVDIDINLPNGEAEPIGDLTWKLPNYIESGILEVSISVQLSDANKKVNLFRPIPWEWKITAEGSDEDVLDDDGYVTILENTPMVAGVSVDQSDNEDTNQNSGGTGEDDTDQEQKEHGSTDEKQEKVVADPDKNNEADNNDSKDNDTESTESVPNDENNSSNAGEGGTEPVEPNDSSPGEEEDDTVIIERVELKDNYIHRPVLEPVYDQATKKLMNVIINKISAYQKLSSLYEVYSYLEDIDELNLDDLDELPMFPPIEGKEGEEISIRDIVSAVKDEISEDTLSLLHEHIEKFLVFAQAVGDNTDELIDKINETSQQAAVLNSSLEETLDHVANWREQSLNLLDQHGVVQENDMGEQQAILTLGNDFQPLLSESQSIAEQAQGNLSSAESVYQTLDTIDGQADTIEQSGEELVTRADLLSTEMTEKMLENQEFADNFSNVLANSRVGDRQNENLYSFLSNPVQTSNQGTITSSDSFTPYFLVLTIFIVVLFTAYVISTLHQKLTEADQFAHEKSLMNKNTPITLITAGIGALEGIAIGVISSYLLQIGEGGMVLWTVLVTTLIIGMLLVATYLLRQLKMIGMFVLLIVMSMYLFLTNAFGTGIAGLDHLRAYSPLQYVESLLLQAVQGNANYLLAMLVIAGIIVIGALANLFVLTKEGKGDLENEGSEEAS